MEEILPKLFHWATFHEEIGEDVHSCFVGAVDPPVLIDPRIPNEGLAWFERHQRPAHIYLTNRLHDRHSKAFAVHYGSEIWCHQRGVHGFSSVRGLKTFDDGELLPGGIQAIGIDNLCPEETVFYVPHREGVLIFGDALIRRGKRLCFVPDELMGKNPEEVKAGLLDSLVRLLAREFDHILMAHGAPWIGGAKAALKYFLESEGKGG